MTEVIEQEPYLAEHDPYLAIEDNSFLPNEGIYWQPYNDYGFASPWAPRLWKRSAGINYGISFIASVVISIIFAVTVEDSRHWCLIPLMLCGTISGADLVAWFRGELDVFDMKTFVMLGFFLTCFLSPLLHLKEDFYVVDLHTPNWPAWFGKMACLNFIGLVSFKIAHRTVFKSSKPAKTFWKIDPTKFGSVLTPMLAVSILASLVIRFFFGGLAKEGGLIGFAGSSAAYAGQLSWIMMLADPLIILSMTGLLYKICKDNPFKKRSFFSVAIILLATLILQFLLVGIRGSRTVILTGVVLIAITIHYRMRPFNLKLVIIGMFIVFVFLYLYGFYKHLGSRGWAAFYSSEAREDMSYELGGASMSTIFLVHNKSDVQAYELYRLVEHKGSFKPVRGMTYAMSILTFIPRGIWKAKPHGVKTRAGTEIQGLSGSVTSHLVYGLAGEAMLNFSYYGIVPAYIVFGCIVGCIRKKIATMEPTDPRFFLVPLIVLNVALSVTADSGNTSFGLLKTGMLPFMLIFLSSVRLRFFPVNSQQS